MYKKINSHYLLIIFGLFYSMTPWFLTLPLVGLMGLMLVIAACVKGGLKGGVLAALWSAGVVSLSFSFVGGSTINVAISLAVYFLIAFTLGWSWDINFSQKEALKESIRENQMLLDNIESRVWYLKAREKK